MPSTAGSLTNTWKGLGGQYAEKGASEDPALQKRFIRAGEFIMSLIGQHPDLQLTNIPGSTFAQKLWEDDPKGPFDLGAAIYNAEGGTNNSYWKYSSGAFGQYYLGSMRDMRLVQLSAEDTQLFLRTPKEEGATWVSGKELAEAFAESVGEKAEALFIQAIRDEQISREVLDEVSGRFRPDGIPKGSLEHDLLSRMLGQADDPLQAGLEGESRLRGEYNSALFVQAGRHAGRRSGFLEGTISTVYGTGLPGGCQIGGRE